MKLKRDNMAAFGAVLVAGTLLAAAPAGAQSIGTSARQMPAGSLRLNLYYEGMQGRELNFALNSAGPCSGGGAFNPGFACGSTGDVPAELDGGALVLRAAYQPWDNLQYYASVGLGDATLRISSVSATSVLTGDRPGFQYAAGMRAVIIPDTVVGWGVALDGRVGWRRHYFNEARPAATAAAGQIRQRLDLYEYQVAVQTGHRFDLPGTRWALEPYGGMKWLRSHAFLKDLDGGGRVGGVQDTFTPFVGLSIPLYEHESLVAEGSFVGGYQYSVGLQIKI